MIGRRGLVAAWAVAMLASGCGPGRAPATVPSSGASALGGTTLTGHEVTLTAMRGHPVVLIFWASWCGPCHDEQPQVNAAYTRWSSRGVDFLGIDLRDDRAAALAFQSQLDVRYPSVADAQAAFAADFGVPAAPAVVFLDTQGRVADAVLGGLGTMRTTDFDAEIAALLG